MRLMKTIVGPIPQAMLDTGWSVLKNALGNVNGQTVMYQDYDSYALKHLGHVANEIRSLSLVIPDRLGAFSVEAKPECGRDMLANARPLTGLAGLRPYGLFIFDHFRSMCKLTLNNECWSNVEDEDKVVRRHCVGAWGFFPADNEPSIYGRLLLQAAQGNKPDIGLHHTNAYEEATFDPRIDFWWDFRNGAIISFKPWVFKALSQYLPTDLPGAEHEYPEIHM